MKDAVATMGTILTDDVGGRDAVHVAVIAVRADDLLSPGQHVGLRASGDEWIALTKIIPIGIVDPFLDSPVKKGERFWLYLYPRTITSLRHNWTHPAFPNEETENIYHAPVQKLISERWLKSFAEQSDVPSYDRMVREAISHALSGSTYEHITLYGSDAHGEIPPEFWDHIEIVAGRKIPTENRAKYFSCSC